MVDPSCLRPADAISFMEHVLASARRDKPVGSHVRNVDQSGADIPKVAKRWGVRLPCHLSPDGVEAVLASVRDNPRHDAADGPARPAGIEVVAIQLDDIDWRAGELTVRGKGKLHDRLPITAEVGDALSCYLRVAEVGS